MSEHTKLPDIVAAMKWLDAFDSCVYSGPEWAAEHARTIKAEIERLRSPTPAKNIREEALKDALSAISGAPSVGEAEHRIIDLIEKQPPAPADGEGLREALQRMRDYAWHALEQFKDRRGHLDISGFRTLIEVADAALSSGRDGGKT